MRPRASRAVVVFFVVFFGFAASLTGACGPHVDAAAKADLDRRLAALPTSDQTYPPSGAYLPMSFTVGQWTEHRLTDAKGATSLITNKLVGEENGGYWLETVTESSGGRDVVKMQVVLLAGRDPSGMEIRALRIKNGTRAARDVDPGELPTVRRQYRSALDLLAVSFDTENKDDANVPAGRFIGCYETQTSGPWGPLHAPSVVCSHPSVPLSGVVRAQAVGGGGVLELVAFGVTGAEGEL
jgi:hypothetical protein